MIQYLIMGIFLGLSAGLAPGPLLTLVISETLQHGIKSGIKIAIAPVITDLPIILLALLGLSKISNHENILGGISIAGSFFILLMGWQGICAGKESPPDIKIVELKSLTKGLLANFLSPHPYLFWFSVGAPTISKAMAHGLAAPLAFTGGFYTFLVGSKIALAVITARAKSFLRGKLYLYCMRFLGLVLCLLAVALFYDGIRLIF